MSKSLIIDPGHGGSDNGMNGYGAAEKHWTLRISLYQYKRLKELGANVGITRTTDISLGSQKRTSLIKNQYDYCMSNHFNAYNGEARGVEAIHSIYADPHVSKVLASAVVEASGLPFRRVFDKKNSRGSDWYYMHRLTGNTATTIMEYGFLDNKKDHAFYTVDKNLFKVAEAVVREWCDILGVAYMPPSIDVNKEYPASRLYKVQVGAFSEKENANQLAKKLEKDGYDTWVTRS